MDAGRSAFYFQGPDRHPAEVLQVLPDKDWPNGIVRPIRYSWVSITPANRTDVEKETVMNNGILQTVLMGVPLELDYRPHFANDTSSTISEPTADGRFSSQPSEPALRDEFEMSTQRDLSRDLSKESFA